MRKPAKSSSNPSKSSKSSTNSRTKNGMLSGSTEDFFMANSKVLKLRLPSEDSSGLAVTAAASVKENSSLEMTPKR